MQFKRGGWQYSEPNGVVTMPGNARQAFPAKRGDGGSSGERGGQGWWLEKGAENGDNRTIRGVQVVYCIFAFTQFNSRKRFARDITQSRFIQRDATRRSHRPDALLYLIRGCSLGVPAYRGENIANTYTTAVSAEYKRETRRTNLSLCRDIFSAACRAEEFAKRAEVKRAEHVGYNIMPR